MTDRTPHTVELSPPLDDVRTQRETGAGEDVPPLPNSCQNACVQPDAPPRKPGVVETLRHLHGMRRPAFARTAGVHLRTLERLELEGPKPGITLRQIVALAHALGVPIGALTEQIAAEAGLVADE